MQCEKCRSELVNKGIVNGVTVSDVWVCTNATCSNSPHPLRWPDVIVNHPTHYGGDTPHETIKCLSAWGLESDALLWNVVKYVSRAGKKGSLVEDLEKAAWYLARRIESLK